MSSGLCLVIYKCCHSLDMDCALWSHVQCVFLADDVCHLWWCWSSVMSKTSPLPNMSLKGEVSLSQFSLLWSRHQLHSMYDEWKLWSVSYIVNHTAGMSVKPLSHNCLAITYIIFRFMVKIFHNLQYNTSKRCNDYRRVAVWTGRKC